ncbi:MAG: hypothetical protein ACOY3Y_06815 [Acidobacteriota bacterium]
MNLRSLTVICILGTVAFASPLAAQSTQFDLGLGFQWLDVTGNEDVHRTQTGQDDGFLLDGFTMVVTGKEAPYDRLRVMANGFGAGPDQRFLVEADRARSYALRLRYNRAEVFNALPGFANPFFEQGIVPGQHTLDRTREQVDLDLELLPGRTISPFIGYSRHSYDGPATTTYHVGGDEFRIVSDLDETVTEYRVGIGFNLGAWRAVVTQGWRDLDADNRYTLAAGAAEGNNSRPVLGKDIVVGTFDRRTSTKVDAPFTNAHVSGAFGRHIRVVGSYTRSDASSENSDFETLGGQFASFELARFFSGTDETMIGSSDSLNWRGEVRLEADLASWLDVSAGYTSSHRELDGVALVNTLYLDTVNFTGALPADVATVLDASTAWERDEDVAELRVTARPTSWLRLWGALSQASQDVDLTPDAAEIVVPGGQGGSFTRDIDRLSAGVAATFGVFGLSAEWAEDDADRAVVRSDYLDRERMRVRASLKLGPMLTLIGTGEWIDTANPTPGVDYTAEIERWALDLEFTPAEQLSVRGGWHTYDSDSRIVTRVPHDFSLSHSVYVEEGEDVDVSMAARFAAVGVEAGVASYTNEGSQPFDLDRTWARLDIGLTSSVGLYGMFERRNYDEKLLSLARFDADRYGLFVRWSRK